MIIDKKKNLVVGNIPHRFELIYPSSKDGNGIYTIKSNHFMKIVIIKWIIYFHVAKITHSEQIIGGCNPLT